MRLGEGRRGKEREGEERKCALVFCLSAEGKKLSESLI